MGGPTRDGTGLALVGEEWSAGAGEVLLEEMLEEMLEGWRRQQQARRLGPSIVGNRERVVRRFVEFTQGWPWRRAALIQLAAQLPAAVLADLLHLSPGTAVGWVNNAGGDWSRYAASLAAQHDLQPNRIPGITSPT